MCTRFLDRMCPQRRCKGKEKKEGRTDVPMQEQDPRNPAAPQDDPVPGTHVLLLFCLIALQQGLCARCFAVGARLRGLGHRQRRPLPALCGGTRFIQLHRGQQQRPPGTMGQVLALRPNPYPRGAQRHMREPIWDCCHPPLKEQP